MQALLTKHGEHYSDEDLLTRHSSGCSKAFVALISRHYRMLCWAIHTAGIAWEDHLDVMQEGLLKIHRYAASYSPNGRASVATWMVTIMRNTSRTFQRTQARRGAEPIDVHSHFLSSQIASPGIGLGNGNGVGQACGPGLMHADTLADNLAERLDVQRVLQQLHPDLRDVLVCTELWGMGLAEYAEHKRIPVGTVKSRRSRAKAEFARLHSA